MTIAARFDSECPACRGLILRGDPLDRVTVGGHSEWTCLPCARKVTVPEAGGSKASRSTPEAVRLRQRAQASRTSWRPLPSPHVRRVVGVKSLPDVVRGTLVRPEYRMPLDANNELAGPREWLRADLVREADNPVDQNAVLVTVDGVTVGYIDAEGAASLAAELDAGIRWAAGIGVAIHPDHPDNPGLRVQITRTADFPEGCPIPPYSVYRRAG